MPSRSIVFLLLLALCVPASAVRAQGTEARSRDGEARRLFLQGRQAYEQELFTEAEDAFVAAYQAMPENDERRTLILLNVAQAIERQGGRDVDALEAWKRFEREARNVADDAALLRASQRIRELEARLSRRQVEPPPQAEVELTTPDESPRRKPHWAGIALTSAGGAMLVVGGVVGIVGLSKRNDLIDRCDGTSCPSDARGDADRLERLGLAADLLIWPGLAMAAAGTVLMFTLDAGKDAKVTASCGLGGCNLVGRF
jgi:hypothetical protein